MESLPTSGTEKLEYLLTAARYGDTLNGMLKIGAPASRLRAYVTQVEKVSLVEGDPNCVLVRYGDLVFWQIKVDQNDVIQGYQFSGYGELMNALGVDFAGKPYQSS